MKEALLYEQSGHKHVCCRLCAHGCCIAPGQSGLCGVRRNSDGILYSASYGRLIAAACDPIEKKPLYHFLPATSAYSIATEGCNFRCEFCQNWQISQNHSEVSRDIVAPEKVVTAARQAGCRSIAYTYTEPTIFFEYAYDIARQAHENNLANIFVTNGYMTADSLNMIRPYLDAANVDIKSFRDEFYGKRCGAKLQPVLDSVKRMKEMGVWVEVTTLVIPGENDSETELKSIAEFIASVDPVIPWHLSRFYPQYKFQRYDPTSIEILQKAEDIGRSAGLRYIYLGNVGGNTDTVCPSCNETLIFRSGYLVTAQTIRNGSCPECGEQIEGIWDM